MWEHGVNNNDNQKRDLAIGWMTGSRWDTIVPRAILSSSSSSSSSSSFFFFFLFFSCSSLAWFCSSASYSSVTTAAATMYSYFLHRLPWSSS
ncbi:hypothetical protein IE53DRAFT_219571 [Violaceomyces palustris]|uniref:Uncharacterized protein n=1 Tax=Violaceomyces palustris TaxID=1673888 RepID=A0ACD0NQC2_9BASI|nr:hypothetical protein IE53DRAFT_219571 [Violaceomyces palustris]